MSVRLGVAIFAACLFLGPLGTRDARADLPPPPGQTRVGYSFRVSGAAHDVVLVAFPMYASGGGHVVELTMDQDVVPVQGWTPGVYSIRSSDLGAMKGSENDDAIRALLESKGHVCVKKVPRVFAVPSSTKVSSITDVFGVDATQSACKTSLAKTLYAGAHGEKGEGSVDASGHRVAPAPFGSDLPPVGDLGSSPAAPSPAPVASTPGPAEPTRATDTTPPPRSGCAGCALPRSSRADDGTPFWLAAVALAGLIRRSRVRQKPDEK